MKSDIMKKKQRFFLIFLNKMISYFQKKYFFLSLNCNIKYFFCMIINKQSKRKII